MPKFHAEHIIKNWNGDKISHSAVWSHIEAWGKKKKNQSYWCFLSLNILHLFKVFVSGFIGPQLCLWSCILSMSAFEPQHRISVTAAEIICTPQT